ncbi:MAG: carboxypeptidase-like regulatory domain-containing protein [Terriglobales bacterium]
MVVFALALPALAADSPGTISGYVRNAGGVPQMGAAVEVLGTAVRALKVFTDDRGFYSIHDLLPGTYSLKVTAPSFLPALRDRVGLRSGSSMVVNVTLNTLFEAIQLGPLRGPADDDDWKWTLRSMANRPVLRVLDDGSSVPAVKAGTDGGDHDLKASLSFLAGSPSEGYGTVSDMSTGFSLEHKILSNDAISLEGNVGYGQGAGAAILRTSYTHRAASGSEPAIALTVRRLAPPVGSFHEQGLQAFSLTTSDNLTLGDVLELRFGSELQTVQFMGRFTAFQPFGTADLHLSPNTVLEYRYASSRPSGTMVKGKDGDVQNMDFAQSGPRVSLASFAPALERAHHQEVSLSQRIGKNNLQVAFYADQVSNTVLTGVGVATAEGGELLPDVDSGTFSYQGRDLDTRGLRLVLQRKLTADLTATLDYGYGGVLDLARPDVELQDARQSLSTVRRHALSAKLNGKLPRCRTQWTTSYGWVSGGALTPVDMFNSSAGQSDPYLNVFLRQPLPGFSFLPLHMEAMLDLRNLMAQGYVPVMGQDGRTVYLVQSARSVRGGVAFIF